MVPAVDAGQPGHGSNWMCNRTKIEGLFGISRGGKMKVLVAIDDLEYSQAAIESITQRKWPRKTEFILCHVIEGFASYIQPSRAADSHELSLTSEQDKHLDNVAAWLERLCATGRNLLGNMDYVIRFGNVCEVLAQVAAECNPDYIILGSHHRSPQERLWLRCIAAAVMEGADCSLEIVRPARLDELIRHSAAGIEAIHRLDYSPRNILVAVDGSKNAMEAVRWLCGIDLPHKAKISVATVIEPKRPSMGHWLKEPVRALEFEESMRANLRATTGQGEAAAQIKERFVSADVSKKVAEGDPVSCLLKLSEEMGADLIVLGAHDEEKEIDARIGSTARNIVESACCSVAVIHTRPRGSVTFEWLEPYEKAEALDQIEFDTATCQ